MNKQIDLHQSTNIGIVGAGSWGTSLAILLGEKGYPVTLWVNEPELLENLKKNRENGFFLPGFSLPPSVSFSGNLEETVTSKGYVFFVVPSHVLRSIFTMCVTHISSETIIVSATKGIEISSLMRMSEVMVDIGGGPILDRIAVLSGPSFAVEVARKSPTTIVAAARDEEIAEKVQLLLTTPWFRTYTNNDVIGVEVGGSLKNVIAIAAGIVDGLGLGANTKAALLTRGLAEMTGLGTAMGGIPLTFSGLSGMGDLILTCNSSQSRNYTTGFKLGQGAKLSTITSSQNMVAEGINTTKSSFLLARRIGVEMPITEQVHAILFEEKSLHEAVRCLMTRKLKKEHQHLLEIYEQRGNNDNNNVL